MFSSVFLLKHLSAAPWSLWCGQCNMQKHWFGLCTIAGCGIDSVVFNDVFGLLDYASIIMSLDIKWRIVTRCSFQASELNSRASLLWFQLVWTTLHFDGKGIHELWNVSIIYFTFLKEHCKGRGKDLRHMGPTFFLHVTENNIIKHKRKLCPSKALSCWHAKIVKVLIFYFSHLC